MWIGGQAVMMSARETLFHGLDNLYLHAENRIDAHLRAGISREQIAAILRQ